MFYIGLLGKTYGFKGYIRLNKVSFERENFYNLKGRELILKSRDSTITKNVIVEDLIFNNNSYLLKFLNLSLEELNSLKLFEVWMFKEDTLSLKEGEYYISSLIGFSIVFEGVNVGSIIGFFDAPQFPLLEVKALSSKIYLIPFSKIYIGEIDFESKTLSLLIGELLK